MDDEIASPRPEREGQQLGGHPTRAHARRLGIAQPLRQRAILGPDQRLRHRQGADNAHQDVVEVVGESAGQHAE
jgi:hypothetical protein